MQLHKIGFWSMGISAALFIIGLFLPDQSVLQITVGIVVMVGTAVSIYTIALHPIFYNIWYNHIRKRTTAEAADQYFKARMKEIDDPEGWKNPKKK